MTAAGAILVLVVAGQIVQLPMSPDACVREAARLTAAPVPPLVLHIVRSDPLPAVDAPLVLPREVILAADLRVLSALYRADDEKLRAQRLARLLEEARRNLIELDNLRLQQLPPPVQRDAPFCVFAEGA